MSAAVVGLLAMAPDAHAQTGPGTGYFTPPPGTETFTTPPDPPSFVLPGLPVEPIEEVAVLPETRGEVQPAGAVRRSRALPVTGGDVLALGGIGGALVVGGGLLLVSRRRIPAPAVG